MMEHVDNRWQPTRSWNLVMSPTIRAPSPMGLVAEHRYRQLAREYRRLAALSTNPADKLALELLAIGWDKIADSRGAPLDDEEKAARS